MLVAQLQRAEVTERRLEPGGPGHCVGRGEHVGVHRRGHEQAVAPSLSNRRHGDDVADPTYAGRLNADTRTHRRVTGVVLNNGYRVTTAHGSTFTAPIVIAATGGFGNPYRPALPGLDEFPNTVLHAAQYRSPERFHDQRVIMVGAGNSAVQIATELAEHTHVTLATRKPVKFSDQRPFGRDLHFWLDRTGLDYIPIGPWLPDGFTTPVLDTGVYRDALKQRRLTADRCSPLWRARRSSGPTNSENMSTRSS
ncbi:NAD(P)-binding domain-containing protein [Lentzea sp. NPDC034063]|uniref:NAD(P)-binding domain-containing protein n=1 Tax=unclassified Lentzea TaxID=2643253 RepID=UPI0033C87098